MLAASLLWLCGLMLAALLAAPAVGDPRGEITVIAAAVRTAFWFTAGSALAAMAVDGATHSARPPPGPPTFWGEQRTVGLSVAACAFAYFAYGWLYPEGSGWGEYQRGRALSVGIAGVVYLIGTTALHAYTKVRAPRPPARPNLPLQADPGRERSQPLPTPPRQ